MAVSVTRNLTTFSLAQDNTGGTWVGASGAFDTEVFFQGTASWYYQTPKNSVGDGNFTPTSSVDMSATDTHLYWAMKCDVFPFCELLNTGATASGLMVKIESSASDYVTWHIAGKDTWGGEWKQFVLDINNTANTFSVTGTLDLTAVTKISFLTDNSNSGNIRIIDNTNINAVRFGTGLTATGTDFTLLDIAAADELVANKYGVLQIIDGNVHCQGKITIGSGATTTTLNSTDEILIYKDVIISTGLYELSFVGSGNTSIIKGLVAKGAGTSINARYYLDASDATADVTITGSTFIRAGLIDFASTSDIQTSVFNNCLQIDPSTSTFKSNSISNYTGAEGGAILFPSTDANFSDLTFSLCDQDIEYTASSDSTTPTLTNIIHDDEVGDFDINNTSGSAVTFALSGTSNGNSSTGSAVTFSSSSTLTLTVKDEDGIAINLAHAYIDDNNNTPFIMNKDTNASGIATESWTGGAVVGATWRVRKYGYKAYTAIADVPASGTKDIPVTLIADPQQV